MKKKSVVLTCIVFVLVLILPVVILAAMDYTAPAQYGDSFLAGLGLKYELLKETDEPKIVVIGGSSVAFGIDTELMEEYLPYRVVNFGLYATLGTKLMLDLSRNYINDGDIVVVAPELDAQTLSLYFNAEATWQAAESDRSILRGVAFDNWSDMVGGYWSYLSQKLEHAEKGVAPVEGVYSLASLDENGDIDYPKETNVMLLGYDPTMTVNLTEELISDEFIDYLNEYARDMEKKGASCYFSFSPTNASALSPETDDETILAFFDYVGRKLDFEVISDINDCFMEENYFYDTNFHLNNAGATAHTASLIEDLRRVIGDPAPVSLEIPAAPEKEAAGSDAPVLLEDDEDVDYAAFFTWEDFAGGVMITGVTEEGKTRSVLKTPSACDGKAVLAIGEGAFANCDAVEIHIGKSVVQLYNRLFDGCSKLERIYFNAEKASDLAAGEQLLDGAPDDVTIYMTLKAYSSFISDYFWTRFAGRMDTVD